MEIKSKITIQNIYKSMSADQRELLWYSISSHDYVKSVLEKFLVDSAKNGSYDLTEGDL